MEMTYDKGPIEDDDGREWDSNKALALTAYAGWNRSRQIIDAIHLLNELHGWRDKVTDMRCKTCRDSRGRPCPFPCETYIRFAELLEIPVEPDAARMFRDLGRMRNGQAPLHPELLSGSGQAELTA